MVLYVIGLGLYDEKDITVRSALAFWPPEFHLGSSLLKARWQYLLMLCRGLEAVKRCSCVFLEAYTSVLMVPKERLVRVIGAHHQCLACLPAGRSDLPVMLC